MNNEILAVYDISNPRRLRRIGKLMEKYGVRVQKSVFECSLTTSAYEKMKNAVSIIMDPKEDTLRIYPLLSGSRIKQTILGNGIMVDFPDAYIC